MKRVKDVKKHAVSRVVFTSLTLFISFVSFVVLAQQKPPLFRARIDLMQLDVTVLDNKGQPVRGLTAADFTLLEDNKPQTIEGFTAIDVPERTVPGPAWEKRISPDVTTNEIDNQRIFVLVLDDGLGVGCCTKLTGQPLKPGLPPQPPPRQKPDPWAARELQKTAELFIDTLGPRDLAAVVFTGATYRANQNLTLDRARLLKAVRAYPVNDGTLFLDPGNPPPDAKPIPQCLASKQIIRMIDSVVTNLASLPDRRKSIVYFGGSLPWASHPTADECSTYWMWQDVFDRAKEGHVTINPVQTAGLMVGKEANEWNDRYLTVADYTGGRAVINTNDFAPGVRQIFLENSSYYLLAYQPTNEAQDGRFRRMTVTVNRPDVEVRTRRSYWAPRERPADAPPPAPVSPEVEALSGILPLSKLNLRVAAAPFAVLGGEGALVTLAVGLRQPAFADRTPEQVEVLVKAFAADGAAKASDEQTIPITVPAARPDINFSRYEVLGRLELPKPGHYELRLSVHSVASDTRGSVYVDVDVPDFKKEKLSLSGVVLTHALSLAPVAPARALRDVIPVVPTTERAFAPSDPITAFLMLYQGGNAGLMAATVKVQIQDATGKSVFDRTDSIAADRFDEERAAAYQLRLPLTTLSTGEYLLTFEATGGKTTARRDVRFQVR